MGLTICQFLPRVTGGAAAGVAPGRAGWGPGAPERSTKTVDADRTYQLREYDLEPGSLDRFFEFWSTKVVPLRERFGFRVEWHVAVPEESRFLWMISAEGDEDAFTAVADRYQSSPERAEVFAGLGANPQRRAGIRFVELAAGGGR